MVAGFGVGNFPDGSRTNFLGGGEFHPTATSLMGFAATSLMVTDLCRFPFKTDLSFSVVSQRLRANMGCLSEKSRGTKKGQVAGATHP